MKYKYTVEFEWDPADDIENDEYHVTTVEDDGICTWHYGIKDTIVGWKLLSKKRIEVKE